MTLGGLVAYGERLARAASVEEVIEAALSGLDELLGYPHSLFLVLQPELGRLVTIASRGYEAGGAGSEVPLGQGIIGMVGARGRAMRIGNLHRMLAYARSVQRPDDPPPVDEIRLPGLPDAQSQLAAPLVSRGQIIGVLAIESSATIAFGEDDERSVTIAAHLVAAAFEREQMALADPEIPASATGSPTRPADGPGAVAPEPVDPERIDPVLLRFYPVDGSVFLDDDYVIKGVAGRLLWKVTSEHQATGRTAFTNREAKLDPALELPEYRDNFESRLILLKRRLDEREAPIRIRATGRGRFELEVQRPLRLEQFESS